MRARRCVLLLEIIAIQFFFDWLRVRRQNDNEKEIKPLTFDSVRLTPACLTRTLTSKMHIMHQRKYEKMVWTRHLAEKGNYSGCGPGGASCFLRLLQFRFFFDWLRVRRQNDNEKVIKPLTFDSVRLTPGMLDKNYNVEDARKWKQHR